jgi:hypothetical protein
MSAKVDIKASPMGGEDVGGGVFLGTPSPKRSRIFPDIEVPAEAQVGGILSPTSPNSPKIGYVNSSKVVYAKTPEKEAVTSFAGIPAKSPRTRADSVPKKLFTDLFKN